MAIDKQMELFEEGGLMDEGNTVDPVSGNEVPVGSTQEEVRDDIPAQLSEGEFVLPADVVRYHGLDKIMALRDEAKAGLARMEAMGQMGNSEEATLPDDIPFSIEDLDMEDEDEYNTPQEFAYGGVVQVPGTNYTTTPNPGPTTGFRPYVAPSIPGYTPQPIQAGPQYQGIQLPGTQFVGATEKTNIPTFTQTIGANPGQYDEFRTYVNSSGQTLRIPFKNGQPLYPIPQGYTLQKEDAVTTESTVPTTTVGQKEDIVGDGEGRGVDTTTTTPTSTGTLKDLGLDSFNLKGIFGNTESEVYNEAVTSLGLNQLGSLSPSAAIGSLVFGKVAPNTKAVMMNQSRLNASNILGVNDINTASVEQLNNIGNIMKTANNFALKDNTLYNSIKTGTPAGVSKDRIDRAVATISGSLAEAVQSGIISSEDLAGIASLERDRETGAYTSSSGTTVTERATVIGPDGKTTTKNISVDKSVMDYVNAMLATDDQMTPTEKANARASTLESVARQDVTQTERALGDPSGVTPSDTSSDNDMSSSQSAASAGYRESTPGGGEFGNQPDSNVGNYSQDDVVGPGEEYDDDFSLDTSGSYVENSSTGSDDSDDKIVCTAMNNAYGFGSFRQTVWLQHSKNMDPAYQKGYHRIFKPLIKFAYKDNAWYNMFVRGTLEGIARRRTADIWMQKHGKRHLRGAMERTILEPLCYIVGKIK